MFLPFASLAPRSVEVDPDARIPRAGRGCLATYCNACCNFIRCAARSYRSSQGSWQLRTRDPRTKVKLLYDERSVSIYYDNVRIAEYQRDRRPGRYTTLPDHRWYAAAGPAPLVCRVEPGTIHVLGAGDRHRHPAQIIGQRRRPCGWPCAGCGDTAPASSRPLLPPGRHRRYRVVAPRCWRQGNKSRPGKTLSTGASSPVQPSCQVAAPYLVCATRIRSESPPARTASDEQDGRTLTPASALLDSERAWSRAP